MLILKNKQIVKKHILNLVSVYSHGMRKRIDIKLCSWYDQDEIIAYDMLEFDSHYVFDKGSLLKNYYLFYTQIYDIQ